MPTYKELLKSSIENVVRYEYRSENDFSAILVDVIETLLKAERDAFLADGGAGSGNKGNGYYSRLARQFSGAIRLRVPRDRMGRFQPLLLELMRRDEEKVSDLALKMYVKGMTTRDVSEVIGEIYGESRSAAWVSTLTGEVEGERVRWQARPLAASWTAIFVDAMYLSVRRDTVEKEAVCVALGLKSDGRREILGLWSMPEESAAGWKEIMGDIRRRGVREAAVMVGDGLSGLPEAVAEVFPAMRFQSCVIHKIRRVLLRVRAADKAAVSAALKEVFDLDRVDDDPEGAAARLVAFIGIWKRRYPGLPALFPDGLVPLLFTYLQLPPGIRRMLYTTNWIERLNKHIRKTTRNRNSFPNETSLLNAVFLAVMDFENRVYSYPIYQVAALNTPL